MNETPSPTLLLQGVGWVTVFGVLVLVSGGTVGVRGWVPAEGRVSPLVS